MEGNLATQVTIKIRPRRRPISRPRWRSPPGCGTRTHDEDNEVNVVDVRAAEDYAEEYPGRDQSAERSVQTLKGLRKDKTNVLYAIPSLSLAATAAFALPARLSRHGMDGAMAVVEGQRLHHRR